MARIIITEGYTEKDIEGLNHLHCEDCNKFLTIQEPKWIVLVEGLVKKLICRTCKEKQDMVQ